MTLPPLHHGRDDDADRPAASGPGGRGLGGPAGPGAGLRRTYTFVGVLFACALIGFLSLRLLGVERGSMTLPAALGVLAVAAVAAAVITRVVGRR
ncbi:hypothetical protein KW076_04835 [Micrococcus porci]|uniref:hypothetical protein n=1 Tax=Micrococcus TaxID=1269 RepID=UPI001CCDC7C9|nr:MULTISPECIES: hypothetical protein [Micrococcus]MCG7422904.1 hypothetical protein [Micrococcus sp. ACRRV]UBH25516.1 hypothetical protein KW076_04835 [Micrococcus porci]